MQIENLELEMKKLYKYCLKLSGSHWLADDLVQETIWRVYRLQQTDLERTFTYSFLCKTAKNLLIDYKRKHRREVFLNTDIRKDSNEPMEYEEMLELLLRTLTLGQSMLVILKDVFGYSSKEIAAMLRVSNEAVKTNLHRSRKHFKEGMEQEVEHPIYSTPFTRELLKVMKQGNPKQIFHYCRLLEIQKFQPRKAASYLVDPDGNLLEIQLS